MHHPCMSVRNGWKADLSLTALPTSSCRRRDYYRRHEKHSHQIVIQLPLPRLESRGAVMSGAPKNDKAVCVARRLVQAAHPDEDVVDSEAGKHANP